MQSKQKRVKTINLTFFYSLKLAHIRLPQNSLYIICFTNKISIFIFQSCVTRSLRWTKMHEGRVVSGDIVKSLNTTCP